MSTFVDDAGVARERHGHVTPQPLVARCGGPGMCGDCRAEQAYEAHRAGSLCELAAEQRRPGDVACPSCGHRFDPSGAVRVTEAAPAAMIEYADPGYQGQRRWPLDTVERVRAAWSGIAQSGDTGAGYSATDLTRMRARVKAAMRRFGVSISENSTTEALINGKLSFDDIRERVRRAIRARLQAQQDAQGLYCWAYIVDISDTDVVYADDAERLWQCSYAISGDEVTLGEQSEVARTYAPVGAADDEPAMEALADVVDGRVLEAKGTDDATGGRIYRVQLIAYGDSKNGRRYSESVLSAAVPLYEGAKAYNRHRSDAEMVSGTIEGLVGYYRDAAAGERGIEADLHLLPSATHAAEALDAALALESGEPLVGLSHDVYARFRPVAEGGRQIQDATEITTVNSVDIVSRPAAGGAVTRAVAGGDETKEESDVTAPVLTAEGVLAVHKGGPQGAWVGRA